MMISPCGPRVEVSRLGSGRRWTLFEYCDLEKGVQLESLGIEVGMTEIYRRVNFEPETPETPEKSDVAPNST